MVNRCNNSKTRYESLLKVLETPKERGSIVLQYITEYHYEDNEFINQLISNNVNHLNFINKWVIMNENQCENVISWINYLTLNNEELLNLLNEWYSINNVDPDKLKKSIKFSSIIDGYLNDSCDYQFIIEKYFNSKQNKGVLFNLLK